MAAARGERADANVPDAAEAAGAAPGREGSSMLGAMNLRTIQRAAGNRAAATVAERLRPPATRGRVLARSTSLLTELYATQVELLKAIGNAESDSSTQESMLEELTGVNQEIAEEQARIGAAAAKQEPSVTGGQDASRSGVAKQYSELAAVGWNRVEYALKNAANARHFAQQFESGEMSATAAEEAAVSSRRSQEAATRAKMPGPEPAKTLSDAAARRNIKKYGDPLGYRDPEHVRSHKPYATTGGIISGSGKTSFLHNAGGVAAGALGVIGGVLAVGDVANQLAGRVEVELEGLDPADFEVDHEWKGVPLGEDEKGTKWWCTIRVERSILFRKGFYVVDVYLMA